MIAAAFALAIGQTAPPPTVRPAPPPTLPPPPLAPTSAWRLDRAPLCTIARDYDQPGAPLTIGWQRVPTAPLTLRLLTLIPPADPKSAPHPTVRAFPTTGTVTIGGTTLERDFGWYLADQPGALVVSMTLRRPELDALIAAPAATPPLMTVWIDGYPPVSLSMADLQQTFARLETCNDAAEAELGISAEERAAVAERPVRAPGQWITSDDYPPVALREDVQGTSLVTLRVAIDGSVDDCRLLLTSGSDQLDETTCRLLRKRGRFTPARDRQGNPVVSHIMQPVRWVLSDY